MHVNHSEAYEKYVSFIPKKGYPNCSAYLLDYVVATEDKLLREDFSYILTEEALADLAASLFDRLYNACSGLLSVLTEEEINVLCPAAIFAPSLITDAIREEASERVFKIISDSDNEEFKSKYPLFEREMLHISDAFFGATKLMLERIILHKGEIEKSLLKGKAFSHVISVPASDSDPHNGGQITTVVVTDAGAFIYKPHDLQGDVLFAELIDEFLPNTAVVPACVTHENVYGFAEYIENKPTTNMKGAAEFYYRVGKLLALMTILGSSDFHEFNLLACESYPAPIDLETLLWAGGSTSTYVAKSHVYENAIYIDVSKSILHTGALPNKPDGSRELSPLFDTSSNNASIPEINGRKLSVVGFEKEFTEGFKNAYHTLLAEREALIRKIDRLSDIQCRVLSRNSAYYAGILNRLSEPKAFSSEEKRSDILKHLLKLGGNASDDVRNAEYGTLICHDVPLFNIKGDSCDLYLNQHVVIKNFFLKSGVQNAKDNILSMSEDRLAFEKKIIENAFHLASTDKAVHGTTERVEVLSRSSLLKESENLFRKIKDISFIAPSGRICFAGIKGRGQYGVLRDSLIDGNMGIALYAAALSCVSENVAVKKEAVQMAEDCINSQIMIFEKMRRYSLSPSDIYSYGLTGIAGFILALMLSGKYLGRTEYIEEARVLTAYVREKFDATKETTVDLYGGLAGLIHVLYRFPELEGEKLIRCAADQLMELRTDSAKGKLWTTTDSRYLISGAGHGMAGIADALWKAGKMTGNESYTEAAADALKFESDSYSVQHGTWVDIRVRLGKRQAMHGMCSGAPGIGIMMLGMIEDDFGNSRDLYDKAVETCLSHELNQTDHLCCGNSATLEFLLSADAYENGRFHEIVSEWLDKILERKNDNGDYSYGSSWNPSPFDPTLFKGAAGIGYEILRYAFPDQIEPLL